jgi:protein-disulfide isomerase
MTLAVALAGVLLMSQAGPAAVPDHAPVRGAADARTTVLVFADFDAQPAVRAAVVLRRFQENHPADVRVVFRHHPSNGVTLTDRAARAAAAQGRFWEMHDLLFGNPERRSEADLIGMARQIGIDVDLFAKALAGPAGDAAIKADEEEAARLKLPAGLAVFVNGQPLTGPITLKLLEAM